jgi:hypothetical protein
MSTSRADDDREYPGGKDNFARLLRWLVDEGTDQRIRRDSTEAVTMTGEELFDLLLQVTDWAYHNGIADIHASVQRDTGLDILNLDFPVDNPLTASRAKLAENVRRQSHMPRPRAPRSI